MRMYRAVTLDTSSRTNLVTTTSLSLVLCIYPNPVCGGGEVGRRGKSREELGEIFIVMFFLCFAFIISLTYQTVNKLMRSSQHLVANSTP